MNLVTSIIQGHRPYDLFIRDLMRDIRDFYQDTDKIIKTDGGQEMIDNMIDKILAILILGVIIGIVKWAGFFATSAAKRVRRKLLDKKYPLRSEQFPIKALKLGDCVEIPNLGEGKYQDKSGGKYYIESLNRCFTDGSPYVYLDRDYLIDNSTKLFNKNVVKWQK